METQTGQACERVGYLLMGTPSCLRVAAGRRIRADGCCLDRELGWVRPWKIGICDLGKTGGGPICVGSDDRCLAVAGRHRGRLLLLDGMAAVVRRDGGECDGTSGFCWEAVLLSLRLLGSARRDLWMDGWIWMGRTHLFTIAGDERLLNGSLARYLLKLDEMLDEGREAGRIDDPCSNRMMGRLAAFLDRWWIWAFACCRL
ncbi:hypothetical protein ACLOJK_018997 [Asimina triloba]